MKKYKGSLISLKLRKRQNPIDGIVVDYDDEWTLLKHNPGDYVLDGFTLVNNKKVRGFQRGKDELFREKVIKLKKESLPEKYLILLNFKLIIESLASQHELVQIETNSEFITQVGYASLVDEDSIFLDSIKPNGKKGKKMTIPFTQINAIQFKNDYLNSIKLYSESLTHRKK